MTKDGQLTTYRYQPEGLAGREAVLGLPPLGGILTEEVKQYTRPKLFQVKDMKWTILFIRGLIHMKAAEGLAKFERPRYDQPLREIELCLAASQ